MTDHLMTEAEVREALAKDTRRYGSSSDLFKTVEAIVARHVETYVRGIAPHRRGRAMSGDNVVQRIVNAWDCCGTCAGGVYAESVRPLRVRANKAEAELAELRRQIEAALADLRERVRALADEWSAEAPSLVRNAYSGRDVIEGATLERCADDLRALLDGDA